MRPLTLIAIAAATTLSGGWAQAQVGGPASLPRVRVAASRGYPRGVGLPFWLDPETVVVPRVERAARASTAALSGDEAIVQVRPGASIIAFALRHGLAIHRALGL